MMQFTIETQRISASSLGEHDKIVNANTDILRKKGYKVISLLPSVYNSYAARKTVGIFFMTTIVYTA